MNQQAKPYWHPFRLFALFSLFSLFSLFAIPTGNPVNWSFLLFLPFLLCLLPTPSQRRASS